MDLWSVSERKWALESESKSKIEYIIKIYPIMWFTPLTPMDTNNLPPWGQSVKYY